MLDKILLYAPIAASISIIGALFPFITKSLFIHKIAKFMNNREYTSVIKNIEWYFKKHSLNKYLIETIAKAYQKTGSNQKAIHYFQLLIDKGLLETKYEVLHIKTILADLLFDLNQTTEAMTSSLSVKSQGFYSAHWCMIMGKIYFSQLQFSNALHYFERALGIKNIANDKINELNLLKSLASFFINKESSHSLCMNNYAFTSDPMYLFPIALYYFGKKDYSTGLKWIAKSQFDSLINEIYKNIFQLLLSYYAEIDYAQFQTIMMVNLQKYLITQSSATVKLTLLLNVVSILAVAGDKKNAHHYLLYAKTHFGYEVNTDIDAKAKQLFKRCLSGYIMLDIFNFSNKKPLDISKDIINDEFNIIHSRKKQLEYHNELLEKYNKLSNQKLLRVALKIVSLCSYKNKRYRLITLPNSSIKTLQVFGYANNPTFKEVLFIFKRMKSYDINIQFLYAMDDMRKKYGVSAIFVFLNMPIDADMQEYSKNFQHITLYDRYSLCSFLESMEGKL